MSLGVRLSRCVCVRRISLDGEGNALYPVLSCYALRSTKPPDYFVQAGPRELVDEMSQSASQSTIVILLSIATP